MRTKTGVVIEVYKCLSHMLRRRRVTLSNFVFWKVNQHGRTMLAYLLVLHVGFSSNPTPAVDDLTNRLDL